MKIANKTKKISQYDLYELVDMYESGYGVVTEEYEVPMFPNQNEDDLILYCGGEVRSIQRVLRYDENEKLYIWAIDDDRYGYSHDYDTAKKHANWEVFIDLGWTQDVDMPSNIDKYIKENMKDGLIKELEHIKYKKNEKFL